MRQPVRQICAVVMALVLTAAPALSCCFGMVGHAHAARHSEHAGQVKGSVGGDHCADSETSDVSPPVHDEDCPGCPACDGVKSLAQATLAKTIGLLNLSDTGLLVVTAHEQPNGTPAMRLTFAPPHGPPPVHRTPVLLKTTLRL